MSETLEDRFGALSVLRHVPSVVKGIAKIGLIAGSGYGFALGIQKYPVATWTAAGLGLITAVAYRTLKGESPSREYTLSTDAYDSAQEVFIRHQRESGQYSSKEMK